MDPDNIESAPVKRARGRPKGSLNKKTIARNEEEPVPFALDVDFESNEIMGESEPIPEPEELEELASPPPPPKLKRTVSRKTRIPDPPPVPAAESEEEPPPPRPKRVRRTPKPAAAPQPPVVQPPPTYLEVLTRGLRAAQATQKAEKVARYDAFFDR